MIMSDIREIAKGLGIKTSRMSKLNLVREIQNSEGNFGCFGTDSQGQCDQVECIWMGDCKDQSRKQAAAA